MKRGIRRLRFVIIWKPFPYHQTISVPPKSFPYPQKCQPPDATLNVLTFQPPDATSQQNFNQLFPDHLFINGNIRECLNMSKSYILWNSWNFEALRSTDPKVLVVKDLDLFSKYVKSSRGWKHLRMGFILSKWPIFYRVYLITMCKEKLVAAYTSKKKKNKTFLELFKGSLETLRVIGGSRQVPVKVLLFT